MALALGRGFIFVVKANRGQVCGQKNHVFQICFKYFILIYIPTYADFTEVLSYQQQSLSLAYVAALISDILLVSSEHHKYVDAF